MPDVTPTAATNASLSGRYRAIAEKCSWSNGAFPTGFSLTITLEMTAEELIYHSVNDTDKGKPLGLDFRARLDGQTAPIENQPRFNQVTVRQLSPDEFEVLELKDGDVIVGSFWSFSQDRKIFVRRGVGKSPEGISKAFVELFERI